MLSNLMLTAAFFGISLMSACVIDPEKSLEIDKAPALGKMLTTSNGMTIYTYDQEKGALCSTGCAASIWPPLTYTFNDAPTESATLIELDHGVRQWTIEGNPLHTFTGDKEPGDTEIDGIGGWFVAREPVSE